MDLRKEFGAIQIYRATAEIPTLKELVATQATGEEPCPLDNFLFRPCGAQDFATFGWYPILGGQDGPIYYVGHKAILLRAKREEKVLPAAALKKAFLQRVNDLMQQTGKVSNKDKQQIKEDLLVEMLPKAFTKDADTLIWYFPDENLFLVGASTAKKADDAFALLRKTLGSLPVVPVTMDSPCEITMTEWVKQSSSGHPNFLLGDQVDLANSEGQSIKAKQQDLSSKEIQGHLENGLMATRLLLGYQQNDEAIAEFSLCDTGIIKGLKLNPDLFPEPEDEDDFGADYFYLADCLPALVNNLIAALGGEKSQDDGE